MNFLKHFYQSSKIYQIFVRILTATAILGIAAWLILAIFVGGRAQSAPLTYHEVQNGVNYKARIRFESLEFLLRSRTISRIDVAQIAWADGVNPAAISEIKTQNRYLAFVSTEPISANTENLGVLSYTISFTPLIKTICVYYFALMLGVFVLLCVWRYARAAFLTLCGFYIFAALALAAFPAPFAFIGLGGFILCVLCALKTRNSRVKLALSYFSVLPLCVMLGEIYFCVKYNAKTDKKVPHEILGAAYTPLHSSKVQYKVDDELVYDITYTHDEYGNRIVPNNNKTSKKCVVLYGCSFAYGAAVDDSETLPAFLAKELPEFNIINLAIDGTGANTALARLEFKIDQINLQKCDEMIAVYEVIPHHIYRAFGVYLGPNYRLNPHGKLEYWGTYKENEFEYKHFWQSAPKITPQPQQPYQIHSNLKKIRKFFRENIKFDLSKSYLKKGFIEQNLGTFYTAKSKDLLAGNIWFPKQLGFGTAPEPINPNYKKLEPNEIGLYFEIVKRLKEELQIQYNTPLNIILWDYDLNAEFLDKYDSALKSNFTKMQIPFWNLSEIIDDYKRDFDLVGSGNFNFKYRVSRWDTHPNALANKKIAKFLAQKIKNGEIKAGKVR